MERRRKLKLLGVDHDCIETLYKKRTKMHYKKMLCIACYVTLPKVYHCIEADYDYVCDFSAKPFKNIVYSIILVPVKNEKQAKDIASRMSNGTVLKIFKMQEKIT